jgi:predicted DNA binding CopG/RHH family protein
MKKFHLKSEPLLATKQHNFKSSMPSLDQLAQKEDTVKVTLSLTKNSVEYFKKEAVKREVCYQAMIRNLIDEYVKHCLNSTDKHG